MSRRRYIPLRRARLSWGLTQAQLGAFLGVSENVISNCERGVSEPSLAMGLACLLVFGQSAAELFPACYESVQDTVGRAAAKLDEELRGRSDPASLKKRRLLDGIRERSVPLAKP
ncbi:MAG TPA: helix-turn-helix transcriptional regulator [Terriglobales bacterium]|nr:helix-turn-helix transcriptional regulator [Terriglobales bacterium]